MLQNKHFYYSQKKGVPTSTIDQGLDFDFDSNDVNPSSKRVNILINTTIHFDNQTHSLSNHFNSSDYIGFGGTLSFSFSQKYARGLVEKTVNDARNKGKIVSLADVKQVDFDVSTGNGLVVWIQGSNLIVHYPKHKKGTVGLKNYNFSLVNNYYSNSYALLTFKDFVKIQGGCK